jgi:hypothetical protein
MKQMNCSQEEAVASAARTGSWPETLIAHAKECDICRDVAQTVQWMWALATPQEESGTDIIPQQARPLPDPGLVWQRARLGPGRTSNIRTVLEWIQIGSAAAAPIGLAGWAAWNWYSIEAMAEHFLLSTWPQLSIATYVLASMAPAGLTVAALALGYPLLAGE